MLLAFLTVPPSAVASGLGTPAFHWGGIEIPVLENSGTTGFSMIQFTEFDKKRFPTPFGEPVRYNDIEKTYGFNILNISKTRPLHGRRRHQSNLFFSPSLAIGISWDPLTRYYQNDIIHELGDLDPVDRGDTDHGLILAYGGELNYRFLQLARDHEGNTQMRNTPVFIGGGFSVGTIHQDLYIHLGLARLRWPQLGTRNHYLHVDLSALARFGYLLKGIDFEELARSYMATQVSVGVTIAPYRFPVRLEYALMGHSGAFLEASEYDELSVYGDSGVRRPALRELFTSLRVSLGSWNFETFNDSRGHKDRGPTYGARFWITTFPGEKWYDNLFNSPLLRWL